jgi:chromate transporter
MPEPQVPREPLARLFLRFLRFGALAWGGPVAQIGALRTELVERERWITPQRFNRTLAVYQALPGPEASELCVYFGYLSRGRIGGTVAGLGFMLPGFVLCLALAWAYVRFGLDASSLEALFYGFQAAVAALIVRAAIRIGRHALTSPFLLAVGAAAVAAGAFDVPFWVTLPAAGVANALAARNHPIPTAAVVAAAAVAGVLLADPGTSAGPAAGEVARSAGLGTLAVSGLRAGLLTFGGAYTVIPFLRRDAVVTGRWMTDGQFLDGIALSGMLPAPLVIFGTFVGYVGGGFPGAIVVTAGIFLPAFAFTLVGHRNLERLVEEPAAHAFLDGVAAAVVGLIAVTAARLMPDAVPDVGAGVIFAIALLVLWRVRARWAIPVVLLGAGAFGYLINGR